MSTRFALDMSASVSTKTWQMPSAWPRTGMELDCITCWTSSAPPRGITRSMSLCSLSSPDTSVRDSRRLTMALSTAPCVCSATASVMISCSLRLVCSASRPPLRRRPLPVTMDKADTWGSTSGRLSKMMSSTPMATVSCASSRPSASLVRASTRPRGFGLLASARMPSTTVCSFLGGRLRRAARGPAICAAAAFFTSVSLARMISSARARSASPMALRSADRSAPESFCSCRDAARTFLARTAAGSSPPAAVGPSAFTAFSRSTGVELSGWFARSSRPTDSDEGRPPPTSSTMSRVPTRSPAMSCVMVSLARPEAMTTQPTPERIASMAASILAPMPPRPGPDLVPMVTSVELEYTSTTSGFSPGAGILR
mmetsp:Transcript_8967/g.26071  ORF Transcript_8967/g.26071 Transcript_8967/m.26071 type:complete len:370 (-) Transcript_8967:583-1692(-)